MKYTRYHALGNDYIVLRASQLESPLTPETVRRICHRHFGVGSDGILLHEEARGDIFSLRIYNPDGSQAEKSGNGLRIFSRYLWDNGLVATEPFRVLTAGGLVTAQVASGGRSVTVEMGQVSFVSSKIPVAGEEREVLQEKVEVLGHEYCFCAATIGNPHCIVLDANVTPTEAQRLGPVLEAHPLFPQKTNVQLLKVLDRNTIQLEIWERGAGYTLASGSSSSAAAAVARRLGLVDKGITVQMPGGTLSISVADDFHVVMTGPVTHISQGVISLEALIDGTPNG